MGSSKNGRNVVLGPIEESSRLIIPEFLQQKLYNRLGFFQVLLLGRDLVRLKQRHSHLDLIIQQAKMPRLSIQETVGKTLLRTISLDDEQVQGFERKLFTSGQS